MAQNQQLKPPQPPKKTLEPPPQPQMKTPETKPAFLETLSSDLSQEKKSFAPGAKGNWGPSSGVKVPLGGPPRGASSPPPRPPSVTSPPRPGIVTASSVVSSPPPRSFAPGGRGNWNPQSDNMAGLELESVSFLDRMTASMTLSDGTSAMGGMAAPIGQMTLERPRSAVNTVPSIEELEKARKDFSDEYRKLSP